MKMNKKAYIVPESATMQVLGAMYLMNLSGATGSSDPTEDPTIHLHAPGRKPF